MQLFRKLLNKIVYQTDRGGKIVQQRATASSINLPVIDEQSTRQQMASLMQRLLKTSDEESVRRQLQTAICDIKALYTETHDGFSQAKGIRRQDQIKVLDMVAFSVAPGYCFKASTLQLFNSSTPQLYRHRCHGAGAPGLRQKPHQVGLAGMRIRGDRSRREPETASLAASP